MSRTPDQLKSLTFYKVLDKAGKSQHGGSFQYPLPTADSPGEWVTVEGPLVLCKNGFHVTSDPTKWLIREPTFYVVEIDWTQDVKDEETDKICCRRIRLVRPVTDSKLWEFGIYTSGSHSVQNKAAYAYYNSTVRASGNSTVEAYENSTVRASGNSTVEAYGNSTVEAYENSTVRASGNSTVRAYGNSTVEASGNSTVEASGNSTVRAYGNSTVEAYGNSTVEAYGNSTVRASGNSTVRAYENSTVEAYENSTVEASGNSTVEAYENSTVEASGNSTAYIFNSKKVTPEGTAIVRECDSCTHTKKIYVKKGAFEIIEID